MAARIRAHNWAATALGRVESWPHSLRCAVDLILPAGFPMIVLWGDALIQIYNDGYRALMGNKHPDGLSQPTRECWPEVWHINEPIYKRILRGETLTFENSLYPITRSGKLEDAWFTLTYSPLRDQGAVAGVLVTVTETTAQARVERELRESEERFRALVTAGGVSIYRMSPDWRLMYQLDSDTLAQTTEPIENWVEKYILPDDLPMVRAAIDQAIRTKSLFELEHRVLMADGSVGWVRSRAVPLLNEAGDILEWFGAGSDVTLRTRAEQRQNLLLAELQHRVRNILGMVRSMARQSLKPDQSAEDYVAHLLGRIDAVARTQVLLTREPDKKVSLEGIVSDELLAQAGGADLHSFEGPTVMLSPKAAEVLTLALHELATNSVKYGVLGAGKGSLAVRWDTGMQDDEMWLTVRWQERGAPITADEIDPGFGTELIERRVPYELGGRGSMTTKAGLLTEIAFPLRAGASVLETGADAVSVR